MPGGDNVVFLDVVTSLDLPVERIIEALRDADLEEIVVIGYKADGDEYFASNVASGANVLWHLERAKKKLLEIVDG